MPNQHLAFGSYKIACIPSLVICHSSEICQYLLQVDCNAGTRVKFGLQLCTSYSGLLMSTKP